jgi:uncharacterized protein YjbI with pentapeptide repeats
VLTGSQFRKALLYRVEGKNVNMNKANLTNATIIEGKINDSQFIGTNFNSADLTRGEFKNGNFRMAFLQRVDATNTNFENSNFSKAKLNNINLQNSNLNNADFTGVSFGNANLSQASMINTIFSNADLSMAFGLKQEQLNKACGNINTRLPLGLILHFCNGTDSTNTSQSSTKGVDQAIRDVEVLLKATGPKNRDIYKKLSRIRQALLNSKRTTER